MSEENRDIELLIAGTYKAIELLADEQEQNGEGPRIVRRGSVGYP